MCVNAYKNTCARGFVTSRTTFAKTCLLQLVSMELQLGQSADFLQPHLNGKATLTDTLSNIFPNSAEILLASSLDVKGVTFGRKQFLLLSSTCAVEVHAAVKEDKNFYLLVEILETDPVDRPKAVCWRCSIAGAVAIKGSFCRRFLPGLCQRRWTKCPFARMNCLFEKMWPRSCASTKKDPETSFFSSKRKNWKNIQKTYFELILLITSLISSLKPILDNFTYKFNNLVISTQVQHDSQVITWNIASPRDKYTGLNGSYGGKAGPFHKSLLQQCSKIPKAN